MNKILVVATLTIGLTALSGCSTQTEKADTAMPAATESTSATASSDKAAYDTALAAAKAEIKNAAAVGGEWRDTGKILKKAEKAAAKGNYGDAIKMADLAKFQAMKGQEQAASQENVGNPGYLY